MTLIRYGMLEFRGADSSGYTGCFLQAVAKKCRPINFWPVGRALPFLWIQHALGGFNQLVYTHYGEVKLKDWVVQYCSFMACVVWTHLYGVQEKAAGFWGSKLRVLGQAAHAKVQEHAPHANMPRPHPTGGPILEQGALDLLQIHIAE